MQSRQEHTRVAAVVGPVAIGAQDLALTSREGVESVEELGRLEEVLVR